MFIIGICTTLLSALFSCGKERAVVEQPTSWQPIQVEVLPNMQVPRAAHVLFTLDDALIAVGGHTTGFVRTQTAEVYSDGRWQFLPSPIYPHDGGFVLPLRNGSVLLGGGSGEDFGIGQSLGLERFDPDSRTFIAVGILDRPRAYASALELQDGRIAVSGNWHAEDAIAILDTATLGTAAARVEIHPVAESHFSPYLFETSDGDILTFGSWDDWNGWSPLPSLNPKDGRYAIAPFSYLVPVVNRDSSQVAVLRVQDGQFSLLETDGPIPMTGIDDAPCHWNNLSIDITSRNAWLAGRDPQDRFYAVKIDYNPCFDGGKATLATFGTADPVPGIPYDNWNMTTLSGGRMALAGGFNAPEGGNFSPIASAWIFHTQTLPRNVSWGWLVLLGTLLVAGSIFLSRRKQTTGKEPDPVKESVEENLLRRIEELMEKEEVFRQKGLTVNDVARMLYTNKTYVSVLVNLHFGQPFNEWVNGYRVRYASRLLLQQPPLHLGDIADASGFASESSFFRIFKAVTGKTPSEWRNNQ